ncbi:hypothetical protein NQ317_016481 [Molorchus minor]|uniref:Uncharacterized protein n=1 Tax=Molorchus minor TaxID=1323400 RepID=A0ABQ9JA15_9CUCU|nr:hypothetical protein NQ317_016481 [Molorchus minor]
MLILLNTYLVRSRQTYENWEMEGIIVNALGMVFIALAILVSFAVRSPTLSASPKILTDGL